MSYVATATDYELLDEGTYDARFGGAEPGKEPGPYGGFLDWSFMVAGAEGPVTITSRSGDTFSPNSKARAWLEGLLGRPMAKGERVDFGPLIGRACRIDVVVIAKEKGTFNRVLRVAQPTAAPQSVPMTTAATGVGSPEPMRDDLPF